MNVYLYGGNSRENATQQITDYNDPVQVNRTYLIDHTVGMLLIAYPNANQTTDFSFNYSLVPYAKEDIVVPLKLGEAPWHEFQGEDGEYLLFRISTAVGFVLSSSCYMCFGYHCCGKDE